MITFRIILDPPVFVCSSATATDEILSEVPWVSRLSIISGVEASRREDPRLTAAVSHISKEPCLQDITIIECLLRWIGASRSK